MGALFGAPSSVHNGPAAEPAAAIDVEVSSVQASLAAEAPADPVAVPVPVDRTPCPRCRFDNPAGATSCGRCHLNSFPRPRMAAVVTEASHDPGPAKPPAVPAAVPVDTTVAVPVAVPVRVGRTRRKRPCPRCHVPNPVGAMSCGECYLHLTSLPMPSGAQGGDPGSERSIMAMLRTIEAQNADIQRRLACLERSEPRAAAFESPTPELRHSC